MMSPNEQLALLALRDCVVIRARWDAEGYRMLRATRLASCVSAGTSGHGLFDYRLTDRGKLVADSIFQGERQWQLP